MRVPCALLFAPLAAAAQTPAVSIDFGSARMRLADSVSATAVSVSPAVRIAGDRTSLAASGTLSRFGAATTQSGAIDASVATRRRGSLSAEVQGIAGGSAHDDGTRTGQWIALARANIWGAQGGVWLGGGVGSTWDGAWREIVQGDVGAWLARDATTLAATISPTVVDDTIAYTDVLLSGYRERGDWELVGSIGARAGTQLPNVPADRRVWGNASVTRWATANVGVGVAAGAYPVDFMQGFPGGQYLSLSIRWRPLIQRPTPRAREAPPDARRFELRAVGGDRYQLRVYAPSARTVEMAGDFTTWAPVRLVAQGNGWWMTTVPLARGSHEASVRIDGGSWRAPPGLFALTDEFGSESGVIVISR
jgi:hypothetical protein